MASDVDSPLTEEQRLLVECNHNLIYYYANLNHLDLDEYYGILALGLCKAAKNYNELSGYSFTTYAMKVLKNEHAQYLRREFGKTRIPEALCDSLDAPIKDAKSSEILVKDVISDKVDAYEFVQLLCTLRRFSSKLTSKEKAIFCKLLDESSVTEVAEDLKTSPRIVTATKHRIKKKWQTFHQIAEYKENQDAR